MSDQPLPLGYVEQPNPPPRPTLADKAVQRAAAEAILPEIIRWLHHDYREAEREDYIRDLMGVAHEWDGFHAACALKAQHWEGDQELVEILGSAWGSAAVWCATAAWVEANCITPKFGIGQLVRTRGEIGLITNIDKKHATYTIATPEFLRKYPDQEGKGGGFVVPFEECATEEAP